MKTIHLKRITALALSILFIGIGCQKSETNNIIDNIIFQDIDKLIILSSTDTITGTCKDLVFEVLANEQLEYSATLSIEVDRLNDCDGYNSFLTDPETGKIIFLEDNRKIDQNVNWDTPKIMSLDHFAGKGEQYIGHRSCSFGSGENIYHFGWIKVKLSANKDTLNIISRGTNYADNKSILAGQTE